MKRIYAIVLAASLLLAACADSDGDSGGTGTTTGANSGGAASEQRPAASTVSSASDLNIAYFVAGEGTSYLQKSIDEAKAAAEEAGASLTVVTANFDPQNQLNQIETAITQGEYNAFLVMALDPALVCDALTVDAVEKGILVSIINQPVCDNSQKEGDEVWAPGTATTVVTQSRNTYFDWVGQVVEDYPEGAKVAALLGVSDVIAINRSFLDALDDAEANGSLDVAATINTDYSAAQGSAAAETVLQANPDLTVIMSGYSPMTRAVVDVVKAAGREDEVAIYDLGGDEWALNAVRDGDIAGTVWLSPVSEARLAVQGLIDIANGDEAAKYIDLSRSEDLPGGSAWVTAENVDQYEAEY